MTEQKSGRWTQAEPDSIDIPSEKPLNPLPMVRLRCLDAACARRVADEFPNKDRGGKANIMRVEGSAVLITYADKMWPYDIADWAGGAGLASDSASARVIACI